MTIQEMHDKVGEVLQLLNDGEEHLYFEEVDEYGFTDMEAAHLLARLEYAHTALGDVLTALSVAKLKRTD